MAMVLKITKEKSSLYTAVLVDSDGKIRWKSDYPMDSESLSKELVMKHGVHQLDVLDQLSFADSSKSREGNDEIIKKVEEVLRNEKSWGDNKLDAIQRQLKSWLDSKKSD